MRFYRSFKLFAVSCFALSSLVLLGTQAHSGSSGVDDGAHVGTSSVVLFSGGDITDDSWAIWSGAVVALNRDLSRPGFMLRVVGALARYDYVNTSVVGGVVDGETFLGDVMIGYQGFVDGVRYSAYAGVEFQHHDLTPPDPSNSVRGSETGFKVAGDIETMNPSPFYFNIIGSYSTAFNTYWARGRVGYSFDGIIVGPEGAVLGDDGFNASRVGAFIDLPVSLVPNSPVKITFSGGYEFSSDSGLRSGDSVYGNVGVTFVF